jgi:predicted nucleic acid-binding protein
VDIVSRKIAYIDSGILINAFRGIDLISLNALEILNDSTREYASSEFVRLETLPKAIYHKQVEEAEFYETFFQSIQIWANQFEEIIQTSNRIARTYGLAGMDALHIAAALSVRAEEFVTTEKTTKPMHRLKEIQITSIAIDIIDLGPGQN